MSKQGLETWTFRLKVWCSPNRATQALQGMPCCLRAESLPNGFSFLFPEVDLLYKELEDFEMKKAAARAVTGVLASHPNSTDVHIINLSLTFHGQELLSDTKLELNSGRRYGLIGLNGIGEALGRRGGRYLSLAHLSHSASIYLAPAMYKARSIQDGWEQKCPGKGASIQSSVW